MSAKGIDFDRKMRANYLVKRIDYAVIGNLRMAQKNGNLNFTLPGYSNRIKAKATYVEYISDNQYKWYGKADDGRADIILLCDDGKITGHISLPDGIFEIYPSPDGDHIITTIDLTKTKDVGCGTNDNNIQSDLPVLKEQSGARQETCPTVRPIRALFLITPAARSANPDINGTVNLSISQFNSCVYNSAVTSAAVLELAGIQDYNFSVGNDASDDANRLAGEPGAQALRNNFSADIVILFMNANYSARGAVATIGPNDGLAYGIVQVNYATSTKTFAHEVGHIYGCRHHDHNDTPDYARGYRIKNWLGIVVDNTIMVGGLNDNPAANRLLNFSNPNVSVSGRATGTSTNNNARRVGETFSIVRGFRADPPYPLAAYVTGPYEIMSSGWATYEAVYSCGSSPYSFSWAYSLDGMNYYTVSSTTDTYNHPFYYQGIEPYYFYARATIVDGLGNATTNFMMTYVGISPGGYYSARTAGDNKLNTQPNREDKTESVSDTDINLFPNPADNSIFVDYSFAQEGVVRAELINNQGGVVVSQHMGYQLVGTHSFTMDIKNLEPGLYYVRFRTINQLLPNEY